MKLSEMEYLKELAANHPERFSDVEDFKLLAKEHGINLDEAYQELEMDDAFVNTHEDPGLNPEVVQLHSHNYYEILYICSGNIQYLIRTERYRIQKGDIIIIPPGVGHQPIMPEGHKTPYKRYVLWLSTEFIKGIAPLFPDNDFLKPQLLRTSGTRWATINNKFYAGIMEEERKLPGWKSSVYGNTMELVTMLYRAVSDKESVHLKSEMPELLDRILTYVEDHLSEEITLDDTGRRFFVSRSTISNVFRKEIGISFYRYVTQRRLVASKNYILEDFPMETIAEKVGFSDYSSFYRAFKGEYGISPRQFKGQQR